MDGNRQDTIVVPYRLQQPEGQWTPLVSCEGAEKQISWCVIKIFDESLDNNSAKGLSSRPTLEFTELRATSPFLKFPVKFVREERSTFHAVFTEDSNEVYGLQFESELSATLLRSELEALLSRSSTTLEKSSTMAVSPAQVPVSETQLGRHPGGSFDLRAQKYDDPEEIGRRDRAGSVPHERASTSSGSSAEKPKRRKSLISRGYYNVAHILQAVRRRMSFSRQQPGSKEPRHRIGSPTEAQHMAHVEFSSYEGFIGLPNDWEETGISAPGVSKRVFAVPISKLRLVPYTGTLFGTQAGIPRVLITLRHALKKWRATEVVYIFRSCAEETECRKVMEELDAGEVMAGFGVPPSMRSVHTAAALLTRWYRQMPECILDAISLEEIAVCSSADAAAALAMRLPDQERALLEWLIDILADVAAASEVNKMTPKNLGLVVAPSLKRNGDPIQMLLSAGKIAEMVAFLIEMRLSMIENQAHKESQ